MLKRMAVLFMSLMIAFSIIPAMQADAAKVTKKGMYGGCFASSGDGAIKVSISSKKLVMKGKAYYSKSEDDWFDSDTVLKNAKRTFVLTKKTKFINNKGKKIKLAAVKKYIKKKRGKLRCGLRVYVKNKKAYSVRIW